MSTGLYSGVSGLSLGVGLWSGVPGLWSGDAGFVTGIGGASLSLNFLTTTSLDSRITFTRASAAMLTDSTGRLTYAPNNLVTFSEQFDNTAWTKGAAVTIGANAGTAPDGTTTADQITITGVDNGVYQSVTVVPGVAYVQSWYVRLGTLSASDYKFALYNNTAGSFIAADIAPSPTPNSTGWTRITYTFTAPAGCTSVRIYVNRSPSVSAGTLFVWGAQLEQVTYQTTPGTYVATTSSAYQGPRFDYDPVTLAPRGLLIEEQRTNLLTYSEQFDNAAWTKSNATISANATTSPDGTVDADKLVENTAASVFHYANQAVTKAASAIQYTATCYVKDAGRQVQIYLQSGSNGVVGRVNPADGTVTSAAAAFGAGWTAGTLTTTSVGNGWWRVTLVATSDTTTSIVLQFALHNGSTNVYTGDGTSGVLLYGAQLEAGAFATSYIPTVASQVTRSADVATMTGTNFSSWYNASEGTFVTQSLLSRQAAIALTVVATVNDGTNSNTLHTFYRAAGTTGFQSTVAGVSTADMNMGPAITAGTVAKIAGAYQVNNFAASTNGGSPVTTASGTLPTVNRLQLGSGIGVALNGHIQSFTYYPTRLPNEQLRALTA